MKVTYPDNLQGRITACTHRARLLSDALSAFGDPEHEPSADALYALGDIADELADKLEAIERAYVTEANRLYVLEHPDSPAVRTLSARGELHAYVGEKGDGAR